MLHYVYFVLCGKSPHKTTNLDCAILQYTMLRYTLRRRRRRGERLELAGVLTSRRGLPPVAERRTKRGALGRCVCACVPRRPFRLRWGQNGPQGSSCSILPSLVSHTMHGKPRRLHVALRPMVVCRTVACSSASVCRVTQYPMQYSTVPQ